MSKFKAIVFDLDGTLLDSLEDIADACNKVLDRHGYPVHSVDAYKHIVGEGMRKLIIKALPDNKHSDAIIDECLSEMGLEYGGNWNVKSKPYDGIMEMLSKLRVMNLKLGVLSNKPQAYTEKCVNHYFKSVGFDVVFGQRDEVEKKPAPDGLFEAMSILGVSKEETLFIGDTKTDIKTAVNAGVFALGVLWGFRDKKELTENGADALISKPEGIFNLLK